MNENWSLQPSLWKPSEKFSRRPHWSSPPTITFGTGVVEQVAERVLAGLEGVGRLAVGVVVVLRASSRRRVRELLVPGVIEEERCSATIGIGLPMIGVTAFEKLFYDADVDRRVVHVVLDAFAEDELQPEDVVLADLEVRAEVEAPAGGVAGEIELVVEHVVPLDVPEHAGDPDVAPLPATSCRRPRSRAAGSAP